MTEKLPSPIRIGLTADEVLKLRGRSKADATAPSAVIGTVPSTDPDARSRPLVEWYYSDITIQLRLRNGQYRVAEVHQRGIHNGTL